MAEPLPRRVRRDTRTRQRSLSTRDVARARVLVGSLLGFDPGETVKEGLERDQRDGLIEDALFLETEVDVPKKWAYVEINRFRAKRYAIRPSKAVEQMELGSKANLSLLKLDRDIVPVARDVWKMVRQLSPIKTGRYARTHKIRFFGEGFSRFAMVYNRLDYASTHETTYWSKPYLKAFRKANRKYQQDWDLRLEFGNPAFFGGNVSARRSKRPYAVPVITIAPLNTIPKAGQFVFKKRRTPRTQMNVRAKARRGELDTGRRTRFR